MHIQDNKKGTIVLAYSGGLDTSAIIPWIKENYNFNVVAFVADIGQSKKDLKGIKEKAIMSGALDCYIADLKNEFVEQYVYPMLSVGALYEGNYLLGTAIARPLIAKAQLNYAKKINAVGLSHGATGKGNDQVRFELAYTALDPTLQIIAPWREWIFRSREDLLKIFKRKNISTTASITKIYSKDENIFHISTEGGILEDPWNTASNDCWSWTTNPHNAPKHPEEIHLNIKSGRVISINGKKLNPYKCLKKLNKLGSKHAIGRIDIIENRLVGMKSRGCYETPGGTIIYQALRALEQLTLDRESIHWKNKIALEMSMLIYDGRWFTPLRDCLQKSSDIFSQYVEGEVIIELYKGSVIILKKRSFNSLYSSKFATFGNDKVYNQKDAQGFIRLLSLSSRIRALKNKNNIFLEYIYVALGWKIYERF
ncbi:argininosuccinate synthase [Buchnera aphidicola (Cinara tujafilina)]|uniref:Argininosuccinate synthase n=1 Tax=Buchnera aphidicola (Cinara tujafilina) TaxID=261317 RepID=F7WYX6_9GAMM|nr:argininosuccinate synthase [Buchnera aphidicola]AEH39626.1 argininosuccinate synthase [Buchnera aphidicola (Cinara tujafilina)]